VRNRNLGSYSLCTNKERNKEIDKTESGKKEGDKEERKQIRKVGRKKTNGKTGIERMKQNRQLTFKSSRS
jgi:hypothetical protein